MSLENAIYVDGTNAPIDVTGTTKLHSLGTRMILEDGRVFVYAKAGGAITGTNNAVKNPEPQGVQYRAIATACAVGGKEVTVTCASPDGLAGTGTIVADEFEGGYILFFTNSNTNQQIRRIVSNTAGTTSITFTFDRELGIAATTSDYVEAMHSPYVAVEQTTSAWDPVVGVAPVTVADGSYFWLQTWGICWCSPQSGAGLAGATGLIFKHDGSLNPTYTTVDLNNSSQYAGYCISGTATGAQAAPFFMLQLCP